MKKLMKFSVLTFMIAALFGMSGLVSAETRAEAEPDTAVSTNTRGEAGFDDIFKLYGVRLDAKTKADLEAAYGSQKARCMTLVTKEKRDVCVKEIEAAIRTKLNLLMPKIKAVPVPVKDVTNIRGESVRADGATEATPRQGAEKTGPQNIQNNTLKLNSYDRLKVNMERLEAYLVRFDGIADRLDSRIAKLVAQGVDTTESSKLLAQARANLKLAQTATTNAKAAFETESNSTNTGATADATIIYNKEMFAKYCAGVPNQATEPLRCLVNGTTYVNSDKNPDSTTTPPSGTEFTKTRAHINEAGKYLIWAQSGLLLSTNSLKPGVNKIGTDAGASTVTEVGN